MKKNNQTLSALLVMEFIEEKVFYITNTFSKILSSTKWSVVEIKTILFILSKVSKYRIFLKKDEDASFNIMNLSSVTNISSFDDPILDDLIDDIPTEFKISRYEFLTYTNINQKNASREIKKACDTLVSKKSETANPLDPKNEKSFRILNWFSRADYNDKNGNIVLEINKIILKMLIVVTQYTKLNFNYINLIDNEYAIQVYIICKIEQKTFNGRIENKKREIIQMIEDFKDLLNLSGKYERISMFKKGVLDVIKFQINKYSDIDFDYELIKKGKKFSEIKIFFSNKNLSTQISKESNINKKIEEDILFEKLLKFGFSKNKIQSLISENDRKNIEHVENIVLSEIKKGKSINNLSGYFIKCLENESRIISNEEFSIEEIEKYRKYEWDLFVNFLIDNKKIVEKLIESSNKKLKINDEEILNFIDKIKFTYIYSLDLEDYNREISELEINNGKITFKFLLNISNQVQNLFDQDITPMHV